MKPHFSDLTKEQQLSFGDGCSYVPDFIFTADCRHHDFNYARGGRLKDKIKADYDLCRMMVNDSFLWWHYAVTLIYWLGLTILPFPYIRFKWGNYKLKEEIIKEHDGQR